MARPKVAEATRTGPTPRAIKVLVCLRIFSLDIQPVLLLRLTRKGSRATRVSITLPDFSMGSLNMCLGKARGGQGQVNINLPGVTQRLLSHQETLGLS
jgi:hypothetical protein